VLSYLLPETADSEFSIASLIEIVNKTMNDSIGNFIHRVLSIAKQNNAPHEFSEPSPKVKSTIEKYVGSYNLHFEKIQMREALRDVIELASKGNEMMSAKEPWKLAKSGSEPDRKDFWSVLTDLLYMARAVSVMLWPFTPSASSKALAYFNIEPSKPQLFILESPLQLDISIEIKSIFNKITEVEKAKLEKFSST